MLNTLPFWMLVATVGLGILYAILDNIKRIKLRDSKEVVDVLLKVSAGTYQFDELIKVVSRKYSTAVTELTAPLVWEKIFLKILERAQLPLEPLTPLGTFSDTREWKKVCQIFYDWWNAQTAYINHSKEARGLLWKLQERTALLQSNFGRMVNAYVCYMEAVATVDLMDAAEERMPWHKKEAIEAFGHALRWESLQSLVTAKLHELEQKPVAA